MRIQNGYIIRSWLVLLKGVPADLNHLGFEVDVEEVLGCDQVGRRAWEFQGEVLLVGLLLGQRLDLFGHLLVHAQELLEFCLLSFQLFLEVFVAVGLEPKGSLVIGFQVFEGVVEGGLESVLLLADAVIGSLLSFDHLGPELIDLRLQFRLALGGGPKPFDEVADLLLLQGYVVLEALVLLLDHFVFVVQGFGPAAEVVRGATELIPKVRYLALVVCPLQLCFGVGLGELMVVLRDFFPEVLLVLPEEQFLIGEFLLQTLHQFLQGEALGLVVGLLRADDFLQILDVLLAVGQASVGLRGEIPMPQLQLLMALEQGGVLISDPQQLRVEDASGCYLVLDELFDLYVFAVVDALQPVDLLFAGAELHGLLLLQLVEVGLMVLPHLLAQLVELQFSELLGLCYFCPERLAIPLEIADAVLIVGPLLVELAGQCLIFPDLLVQSFLEPGVFQVGFFEIVEMGALEGLDLILDDCLVLALDGLKFFDVVGLGIHQFVPQLFPLVLQPDDLVVGLVGHPLEAIGVFTDIVLFLVQLVLELPDLLLIGVLRVLGLSPQTLQFLLVLSPHLVDLGVLQGLLLRQSVAELLQLPQHLLPLQLKLPHYCCLLVSQGLALIPHDLVI